LHIPDPGFSPEIAEQVLSADVTALRQLLDAKKITSVQLVNFFMRRVQSIGLRLNLVTEEVYE
jgi:fatty acid amide hydrolase